MRPFQLALKVFAQAVAATGETLSSGLGISVVVVFVGIAGWAIQWARHGMSGTKMDFYTFISGAVPPIVLVGVLLLCWNLMKIPYQAYERRRVESSVNAERVKVLIADVAELQNSRLIGAALLRYRFRTVPDNSRPTILLTSPNTPYGPRETEVLTAFRAGMADAHITVGEMGQYVKPSQVDTQRARGMKEG